jgi:hypothetical protein
MVSVRTSRTPRQLVQYPLPPLRNAQRKGGIRCLLRATQRRLETSENRDAEHAKELLGVNEVSNLKTSSVPKTSVIGTVFFDQNRTCNRFVCRCALRNGQIGFWDTLFPGPKHQEHASGSIARPAAPAASFKSPLSKVPARTVFLLVRIFVRGTPDRALTTSGGVTRDEGNFSEATCHLTPFRRLISGHS